MEQQVLAMDVRQLEKLSVLQDEDAPNLVADMARGYLDRTPQRIVRMRELLAAGNAAVLANEAHGLATSSGMFGMMRVRMHCKALENLARERPGLEGAAELLSAVEQAYQEARPLLMAQVGIQE
ncbi:Hpt domain-containing protein [Archangium minus]|uniref:Hpt domain-containing protein n=1 Tax=Archangium minus TaxID=83450 RepID=A0ABY9WNQ9_9BACT|nr:Hpt domain-containing protein [Archangium violaceum]QRK13319.1 Hpt domain-containing protein [Archangium violaceum]WNG34428.1 Hpt domain-containing protein [Archangium violaceum]WNG44878.1 Hpt domain-containing protein [Archangium minus]